MSLPSLAPTPLVTFAVIAYNQEKYIREAIAGAFSQTYSPLEIILSDDCSTDETFQIMERMAAEYSGKHRVVLNRNKRNLGLGLHIQRVGESASGEFIVVAAGDDISYPERVEVSQKFQQLSGVTALFTDVQKIDHDSKSHGLYFGENTPKCPCLEVVLDCASCWILGASATYSKSVFTGFPPLAESIFQEDNVLSFRALLLGHIGYISQPLVKYRSHENNLANRIPETNSMKKAVEKLKWNLQKVIITQQWLSDYQSLAQKDSEVLCRLQKILQIALCEYQLINCRSFISWVAMIWHRIKLGNYNPYHPIKGKVKIFSNRMRARTLLNVIKVHIPDYMHARNLR
jgi:glycosyltransferase involved in cell wall biosynthesis